MCHSTGAPRSIRATSIRYGRLHLDHGFRAAAACQERLGPFRLIQETQLYSGPYQVLWRRQKTLQLLVRGELVLVIMKTG